MYRQVGPTAYLKNIKKAAFPLLYNDIGAVKTCP